MLKNNKGTDFTRVTKVDPLKDELIECTTRKEVETANLEYIPDLFSGLMTHLCARHRYSKSLNTLATQSEVMKSHLVPIYHHRIDMSIKNSSLNAHVNQLISLT